MRLSCEYENSSQVYLVDIYKEMFRYQVSIRLLPLILIVSAKEIELWRLELKSSLFGWEMQGNVQISN